MGNAAHSTPMSPWAEAGIAPLVASTADPDVPPSPRRPALSRIGVAGLISLCEATARAAEAMSLECCTDRVAQDGEAEDMIDARVARLEAELEEAIVELRGRRPRNVWEADYRARTLAVYAVRREDWTALARLADELGRRS